MVECIIGVLNILSTNGSDVLAFDRPATMKASDLKQYAGGLKLCVFLWKPKSIPPHQYMAILFVIYFVIIIVFCPH